MYMNQITVIGNATRDAETKETNGKKRTTFGVAVNAGENNVEFFEVVLWGDNECPVKKGALVLVQGAMRSRKWEGATYWTINAEKVQFIAIPKHKKKSNNEEREIYVPPEIE